MPNNLNIFTCCDSLWDKPSGFLAISSLLPRFTFESLSEHEVLKTEDVIENYAIRSLSHVTQILGWVQDTAPSHSDMLFTDPFYQTKIAIDFRGSMIVLNEAYSILEQACAVHQEANRTHEIYFCRNQGQGHVDYHLLCTVVTIFSPENMYFSSQQRQIFYHNLEAGICSTASEYDNRTVSYIPYNTKTLILSKLPRCLGYCILLDGITCQSQNL